MNLYLRGRIWWMTLPGRRNISTGCYDKTAARLVALGVERAQVIIDILNDDASGTIAKMVAEHMNLHGRTVNQKTPVGARGRVYFVECPARALIKIGFTRDMTARMRTLRSSATDDLRLLGSYEGTLASERRVHGTFLSHRRFGEWFSDCPEIRAFMAEKLVHNPSTDGSAK